MGQRTPLKVFRLVEKSHDINQSIPDPAVTVAEMGSWDPDGAIQARDGLRDGFCCERMTLPGAWSRCKVNKVKVEIVPNGV